MDRGYVIMAQNTKKVNYVKCANVLKDSILRVMPHANVTIITADKLPYKDLAKKSKWKLINDWQVYEASPYEYTIKLEADMLVPCNIDYWWDVLSKRDIVVSSCIRNFKNEISQSTYYRKFVVDNNLPNVYNAITYFKKSKKAEDFFNIVKIIFQNWEECKKILKCNINEPATTDWVYALACHILGEDETTMPMFTDMSMIHMKQFINDTMTEDWTDELVYEFNPLRINTFVQYYPFHYHCKNFSYILDDAHGN